MTGRLQNKIALITGGTNGIGLAGARLFVEHGARVVVTGRDPEGIDQARALLGPETLVVQSEAGDLAQVDALLEQVRARHGRLDVLFLNAGVSRPAPFESVTEEQFDHIVGLNFKATFFTIQKALALMQPGASIVLTTSVTDQTGSPNFSVYGASKAALRSLVQSLGIALIERGIRINAVCPGPIDTNAFRRLKLPPEKLAAVHAEIKGRTPIRRLGLPEEVARVALFLASDEASYVVGEEIVVDGGVSLVCLP